MNAKLRSRLSLLLIATTISIGHAQQTPILSVSFFRISSDSIATKLKLQPPTADERLKTLRKLFAAANCGKRVFEQQVAGSVSSLGCATRSTSDAKILVLAAIDYSAKSKGDALLRWGDLTMLPILAESLDSVLTRHSFVLVAVGGKNDGEQGASEYLKKLPPDELKKIDAVIAFDHLGRDLPSYNSKRVGSLWSHGKQPPLIQSVALSAHALNLPEPTRVYGARANVTKPFDGNDIQTITFSSPEFIHSDSDPGSKLNASTYEKTYLFLCGYLLFLDRTLGQALPAPSDKLADETLAASAAQSQPLLPADTPAEPAGAATPPPSSTAPATQPATAQLPSSGVPQVSQAALLANSQPVTLQSNVRVVLLDVVVSDNHGKPVTGLSEDDFRVFEDGKQQKIASFKEHDGAPMKVVEPPALPPNTYTNFQEVENADSVNVILMDSLNTDVLDQDFVHRQVINYLKTIPPGARVAVFTLSSKLSMVQEFTTDSTRLLAALNDPSVATLQASPLQQSQSSQEAENAFIDNSVAYNALPGQMQPHTRLLLNGPASLTTALDAVDPVNSIKELLAEESVQVAAQQVRITLDAFQQLAHYLSAFPGRKNVIWVSGGFPLVLFPTKDLPDPTRTQDLFRQEMAKTAELCTTARMAIYPVYARGLRNSSVYEANANALSSERPTAMTQTNISQMDTEAGARIWTNVGMEDLARTTGGQAFHDTNGLSDVLSRVTNQGMQYYTLSYTPTNTKLDNRFRQMRVEVTKGRYKLAYRRGYYATDGKLGSSTAVKNDPLLSLMAFGLPDVSQLVYTLSVSAETGPSATTSGVSFATKGSTTTYTLDLGIPLLGVKADVLPNGKRRVQLVVRAIAYDGSGKPLNMTGANGALVLTPEEVAQAESSGIHIPLKLELPANVNVHLRSGVYDAGTGNAGTLGIRLWTGPVKVAVAP
jgi:VWFA-related protein